MSEPRKDLAPREGRDRLTENVTGQSFFNTKPSVDFLKRIHSWVNYLNFGEFFPNIDLLADTIREVGSNLRRAGAASYLGLANSLTGDVLVRPGDYSTLLHELTHVNPGFRGSLLVQEAGAYAIEIHACGDFEHALGPLMASDYELKDKRLGRMVAEATMALGAGVFQFLARTSETINEVTLAKELGKLVDEREAAFLRSTTTPEEYLVTAHGLSPFIASLLVKTTRDTKRSIMRSTTQQKKEFIGAFKALASFYHINLGYALQEAIDRTEEHFRNNEALTIQKTLLQGPKEVFARLKEYGYDIEVYRRLSEFMISKGASFAKFYGKEFPEFIEFTGTLGRRGIDVLGFALKYPSFMDAMVIGRGAEFLLRLAETEPEQASMIMEQLVTFDWRHPLRLNAVMDVIYAFEKHEMVYLNQVEKAKAAAISMYLVSIPIDIIDRFPVKLPHDYVFPYSDGGVHANWLCEAICKKILPAKNKESVLDALAKIIKSAYSQALPAREQQLLDA
jgi:hypothetical protein